MTSLTRWRPGTSPLSCLPRSAVARLLPACCLPTARTQRPCSSACAPGLQRWAGAAGEEWGVGVTRVPAQPPNTRLACPPTPHSPVWRRVHALQGPRGDRLRQVRPQPALQLPACRACLQGHSGSRGARRPLLRRPPHRRPCPLDAATPGRAALSPRRSRCPSYWWPMKAMRESSAGWACSASAPLPRDPGACPGPGGACIHCSEWSATLPSALRFPL